MRTCSAIIADMDILWINIALIVIGTGLLLWSVYYYLCDCLNAPYTDMGTEMSFSHYWLFAMIMILLGTLPLLSLSRYWALLIIVPLYLLSIPARRMIKSITRSNASGKD